MDDGDKGVQGVTGTAFKLGHRHLQIFSEHHVQLKHLLFRLDNICLHKGTLLGMSLNLVKCPPKGLGEVDRPVRRRKAQGVANVPYWEPMQK
jgi:hypothetical protein